MHAARDMASFVSDITPDEASRGFARMDDPVVGTMVVAPVGNGIFAVKLVTDDGAVRYQICDERGTPLYAAARSLAELELRFGLSDLKTA